MCWGWFPTPGPHSTKCLYWAEKGEQECHHGSEKQHSLSRDPKEDDSSGKGSHSYSGTRTYCTIWLDRCTRRGPQPSNTQVNCEAKAREVVWGAKSEWIGILATQAGSFCLVPFGWVPWCFCIGAQQTWLYPFTEHVIKVTNDTPFKEWFRWIPLPLVEEVHKHLQEMLDSGTIHPSQSMWCNAVVLVWKKDSGLHFCIDFWCLNAHTKKDSYPLPRIQEALESLVGAGHFSCLDLKSGFWQIKMDESSKQYTAFTIVNLGFFKCNCMPFGLCNVPTTFQWLMQNCLGELNLIYCLIYLDDIGIFLHTAEEHLHHLHVVFDQFREHNLKLKLLKCNFFREEITYLAHQVSKDGVQPSNLNLKAISECAPPKTYTEVCAFLGLVRHYRRFIKGFALLCSSSTNT